VSGDPGQAHRRHVRPAGGGYQATCPDCAWSYRSPSVAAAHTEATHHTCRPVLGPRPLPPGTTVVGAGSMAVGADDPRPHGRWWEYWRLGEVW